jgi:hypothetical protein
MANPKTYVGRGTVVSLSPDNTTWTVFPQLEKFDRSGTTTEYDQCETIDTPGTNDFPVPVMGKNGTYAGTGPYDPENPAITAAQAYKQSLALIYYKVQMIDGSVFTGQCSVSKFDAPKVDVKKVIRFEFEIRILGVETLTPSGGSAISE